MAEYRMTFGQKYRQEKHSLIPEIHPDGWVSVEADSIEHAREKAFTMFGAEWGFIYPADEVDEVMYPLGEIARLR